MELPAGVSWPAAFLVGSGLAVVIAGRSIPADAVGAYFHRFVSVVGFLLAVTGAALQAAGTEHAVLWAPLAAGAGVCAISYVLARLVPEGRGARIAGIAVALLAIGSLVSWMASLRSPPAVFHVATAGAAFGITLSAMILGHWYLVNARLPFELLVGLILTALLVLATRAGLAVLLGTGVLGHAAAWEVVRGAYPSRHLSLAALVGVRVGAGILFAAILGWMALRCAKIRANQSATGILYAMTGVVLVGEITSLWLTFSAGVPI